jgi:hypothetical protein
MGAMKFNTVTNTLDVAYTYTAVSASAPPNVYPYFVGVVKLNPSTGAVVGSTTLKAGPDTQQDAEGFTITSMDFNSAGDYILGGGLYQSSTNQIWLLTATPNFSQLVNLGDDDLLNGLTCIDIAYSSFNNKIYRLLTPKVGTSANTIMVETIDAVTGGGGGQLVGYNSVVDFGPTYETSTIQTTASIVMEPGGTGNYYVISTNASTDISNNTENCVFVTKIIADGGYALWQSKQVQSGWTATVNVNSESTNNVPVTCTTGAPQGGVDSSGNVYIVGLWNSTTIRVMKLSGVDGSLVWSRNINYSGPDSNYIMSSATLFPRQPVPNTQNMIQSQAGQQTVDVSNGFICWSGMLQNTVDAITDPNQVLNAQYGPSYALNFKIPITGNGTDTFTDDIGQWTYSVDTTASFFDNTANAMAYFDGLVFPAPQIDDALVVNAGKTPVVTTTTGYIPNLAVSGTYQSIGLGTTNLPTNNTLVATNLRDVTGNTSFSMTLVYNPTTGEIGFST